MLLNYLNSGRNLSYLSFLFPSLSPPSLDHFAWIILNHPFTPSLPLSSSLDHFQSALFSLWFGSFSTSSSHSLDAFEFSNHFPLASSTFSLDAFEMLPSIISPHAPSFLWLGSF